MRLANNSLFAQVFIEKSYVHGLQTFSSALFTFLMHHIVCLAQRGQKAKRPREELQSRRERPAVVQKYTSSGGGGAWKFAKKLLDKPLRRHYLVLIHPTMQRQRLVTYKYKATNALKCCADDYKLLLQKSTAKYKQPYFRQEFCKPIKIEVFNGSFWICVASSLFKFF